jgi:hypothetical protein
VAIGGVDAEFELKFGRCLDRLAEDRSRTGSRRRSEQGRVIFFIFVVSQGA